MKSRRGSSLIQDLVLIALLVGAAYYFFPSWFAGIFPQNAIKAEIVVNYVDGTSKIISGNTLTPQAVAQSGSTVAISNIVFRVLATPTWQDTSVSSVSGVSWSGTGSVKVDGNTKTALTPVSGLPTTVSNGQVVTVCTNTVLGSTLNTWIPFDYNNHALTFDMIVGMTFNAPGEPAKSIDGACSANLSLKNLGFPALLTVSVSSTVS